MSPRVTPTGAPAGLPWTAGAWRSLVGHTASVCARSPPSARRGARPRGVQVAASAGAACHSGEAAVAISGVLAAMGVEVPWAVGTLRLSVGRHTTAAEVDEAVEHLVAAAVVGGVRAAPGGP